MSLSIATRLRPFSHLPGICAVIPLSNLQCQCFPTLLKIAPINQSEKPILELSLENQGPSTEFTVSLDLEYPALLVWQKTALGFQKLRLHVDHERGLVLTAVRGSCTAFSNSGVSIQLQTKENACIVPKELFKSAKEVPFERLSLGSHTSQEIDPFTIKRDLFALLPMWMRLGSLMPCSSPLLNSGTASLVQKMQIGTGQENAGKEYEKNLHTLLRTGFSGLFVPRLFDTDYQGDHLPKPLAAEDPLILLTEGSKRLRDAFIQLHGNQLSLLPGLPSSFHAGRLLNGACGTMGVISIEWTKRCMRQMHFTAHETGTLKLNLPPQIHRFRLRLGGSDRKIFYPADQELSFCLGQNLFFDRFEH